MRKYKTMATITFKANSNPFSAGGPTAGSVPILVHVPGASTPLTLAPPIPFSARSPTTADAPILVSVAQALTALMLVPPTHD